MARMDLSRFDKQIFRNIFNMKSMGGYIEQIKEDFKNLKLDSDGMWTGENWK